MNSISTTPDTTYGPTRQAVMVLAGWLSLLSAVALVCVTAIWLPNVREGYAEIPSVLTAPHGPVLAALGLVAGLVGLVASRPRPNWPAVLGVVLCEAVPLLVAGLLVFGLA